MRHPRQYWGMAETPTPQPTVTVVPLPDIQDDSLDRILGVSAAGAVVLALAVTLVLLSAALIAWAILRAAKLPRTHRADHRTRAAVAVLGRGRHRDEQ